MPFSSSVNGIVIVDKPDGMTSHDVVNVTRKLFQTRRVGHTGTLDPDATGVLALCLGHMTRLAEYLSAARKHYVTRVTFGIQTDTQDASGTTVSETDASNLTEDEVQALLPGFRGAILQEPPMISALHHEGKRLYELARAGVTVERTAREIEIVELIMTAFEPGRHPVATLEVTCSTGTYIRTLAADIGAAAGVGGIMSALRRTWVGTDPKHAFTLSDSHTLKELRTRSIEGTLSDVVLPGASALPAWPQVKVDEIHLARLRNGQRLNLGEIETEQRVNWADPAEDCLVAVLNTAGEVISIARLQSDWLQPVKVFLS